MSNTSARPGRGWFLAGTILMGLTGVAHTLGNLGADPPQFSPVMDAMRGVTLSLGLGMTPSLFALFRDLTFTMSVTFFGLTALNLMLVFHRDATMSLRRSAAALSLIWLAAFDVMAYAYRVPPALISGCIVWVVFLMAYLRSRE